MPIPIRSAIVHAWFGSLVLWFQIFRINQPCVATGVRPSSFKMATTKSF